MGDEMRRGDLEADFPEWHFWEGVTGGLVYARRDRYSPPVTVRGEDWTALRDEVVRANAGIAQRNYHQAELAAYAAQQDRWGGQRLQDADTDG